MKKRLLTLILTLSLVFPVAYLPVFAPRAHAVLGLGDINLESFPVIVDFVLDSIAMPIAQQMVDQMVRETVEWANTGFEGGPAFVTDTGQFLTNTADDVAGEFIAGNDLGFLCSPFQSSIRLSLAHQYYQPAQKQFQCTLSDVSDNIEGFFNGDFNGGGGWDAWFSMTQNPTNNPYGAYLEAQGELDQRLATKVGLAQNELLVNQGFLSFKDCLETNPSQEVIDGVEKYKLNAEAGNKNGMILNKVRSPGLSAVENEVLDVIENKRAYDPSKLAGACIKNGPIKTAGATIKSQLDHVLGSGLSRLVSAENMEQLVGAFASGLLKRYVFSDKGTFTSDATNSSVRELRDVDGDGIWDGYDYNGDDNLDICHHGLKPGLPPGSQPSDANCQLSRTAENSPYFIPLCEDLARTTRELDKYLTFITDNKFDSKYSNTWLNRSTTLGGTIESLTTTMSRYEIMAYDPAIFELGQYTKQLSTIIQSLSKDGDIKGGFFTGDSTKENQDRLVNATRDTARYLSQFKQTIGSCNNPNPSGVKDLDPVNWGEEPPTSTPEDISPQTEPQ